MGQVGPDCKIAWQSCSILVVISRRTVLVVVLALVLVRVLVVAIDSNSNSISTSHGNSSLRAEGVMPSAEKLAVGK